MLECRFHFPVPLVSLVLMTPAKFCEQNVKMLLDDVAASFSPIIVTCFEGSLGIKMCCTVENAIAGLISLKESNLSLPRLGETVRKGTIRVPLAGEDLWNSGQRFVFKSKDDLPKILHSLPTTRMSTCYTLPMVDCNLEKEGSGNVPLDDQQDKCKSDFGEALDARLLAIAQLGDGWDGDYSLAILPSVLSLCREALSRLPTQGIEVGAVEDGSLDLNWPDKGVYCNLRKRKFFVRYVPEDYPKSTSQTAEKRISSGDEIFSFLVETLQQWNVSLK